jgi:hypothetical protein
MSDDTAHRIAEALEAANPTGTVIGEAERAVIKRELKTEGPLRVDVGAVGESRWATNRVRFDTQEEATAYASDLLARWMGADITRVVPTDHPEGEPIDLDDSRIAANFRS